MKERDGKKQRKIIYYVLATKLTMVLAPCIDWCGKEEEVKFLGERGEPGGC
jgi:hypothetical protein